MAGAQTILLVEDEPGISDTLSYALRTDGFSVEIRATAADALRALEKGGYALVVLDIGLPDQSGLEVLKALRIQGNLPVIILSARGSEIDRIIGLELGADDYVVKPFSPREVVARIKAVLKRMHADLATAVAASDDRFKIDEPRMLISFRGVELELSKLEYKLLSLLLRRPGWVFTRDKLMELCWEVPEASMDRTVDTHIKTIRAKLRAISAGEEVIRTHRGTGYSLTQRAEPSPAS